MTDKATPDFNNNDEAADYIMGVLDAEEAEKPEEAPAGEKTAAPEAPSGDDETKNEDGEPETAIDPPHSWTNELKARWKDIPEDLQREIAQHESERQSKLGKKLEESANTSKAAEAAKQAAEQERQRFAQLSEYFQQQATTIDPVLAEATKTDWTKLAQDNPAEYVAKRAQIEQRVNQLQTIEQERQRMAQEQQAKLIERGTETLRNAIPEWADDDKRAALQQELVRTAEAYGYNREEYSNILDPRNIIVLRDLKEFRAMKAAQASLGEKKAPPAAPRMVKPGTGNTPSAASAQVKALKARFHASHKESDGIALMNAILGD